MRAKIADALPLTAFSISNPLIDIEGQIDAERHDESHTQYP